MKKVLTLVLLFIFVVAFYGCNTKTDSTTSTEVETINVESNIETDTAETSAPTVVETEDLSHFTETAIPTEKETLPFISDYTAEELINFTVPELVELMGYDFDVEFCGQRLVYYTSGGLCFYNDDTLPGFAFFIDEAEGDISQLREDGQPDEQSIETIKENILSGKYDDFDFMCVYGGALYSDTIATNMHYTELSEIIGSYQLSPIVGSNAMRQPINGELAATIYYESVYGKVSTEKGNTPETEGYSYYNEEEAKELNPTAEKICVIKETNKHH